MALNISSAGSGLGSATGATAVEVVPASGSSAPAKTRRFVRMMTFTNTGVATRTLTLRMKDTDISGATVTGTIYKAAIAANQSWSFPPEGKAIILNRPTRSVEALLDAAGTVEFTSHWEDFT